MNCTFEVGMDFPVSCHEAQDYYDIVLCPWLCSVLKSKELTVRLDVYILYSKNVHSEIVYAIT